MTIHYRSWGYHDVDDPLYDRKADNLHLPSPFPPHVMISEWFMNIEPYLDTWIEFNTTEEMFEWIRKYHCPAEFIPDIFEWIKHNKIVILEEYRIDDGPSIDILDKGLYS